MWRNEKNLKRALHWFQKAVRLGGDESRIEIARHYLRNERNPGKAIPHLEKVRQSNCVREVGMEEATKLLKQAKKQSKRT